jgi:hypothetical protein
MSTLDQIHESIGAYIAELQREITALEAARAALLGQSAGVKRSVASRRSAPTRRRGRVAKAASNGNGNAAAAAAVIASGDGVCVDAPAAAIESPPAIKAADGTHRGARRPRNRARPRRAGSGAVEVLLAGKLEAMLRESEAGLSAITISKRSNAGYSQVLGLLRDLEGTGQVRRSGTRRTSLWRLVTDEERIAERAAELEALSAAKSPAAAAA